VSYFRLSELIHNISARSLIERDLLKAGTAWSGPVTRPTARPALMILGTRGVPAAHGGFETFAEKFALHMVDQGWQVTVYCQGDDEGGSKPSLEFSIDHWRGIRRVVVAAPGDGPLSTVIFDWRCVLHARREAGLPLVLGYNTACFLPLLRMQNRPVLTNMDGIEWKRSKWPPAVRLWFLLNERIGCATSTAVIADHPEINEHLKSRCPERKIVMIPYGADLIESADARPLRTQQLEPNTFLMSVGRIEPENSTLQIVRAFSRRQRPYSLVCVGKLDPERNAYHRQVKAAASAQVRFPGAIYDRETIQSMRWHALAYVHGHTVGGTNPSLVEALGAGNPVLAHRNRFNMWTAGPEQFYFSSEGELDVLFDHLAEDPKSVSRARKAARRRHGELFEWPRIFERYQAVCSQMISEYMPRVLVVLVALLAGLQSGPAHSEYILGPGDKLDITVSGSPPHRAAINADGQVAVPQVGYVGLTGLSLAAAQRRLQDAYRDKKVLLNADVLLDIDEYRPFYITGDVAHPGAYPFRPDITVRQAVALAGGLDMIRFHFGENPFIRGADLRNEYESLKAENLRVRLRQRRLQAELQGKADADFGDPDSLSVSPAAFNQAVTLEKEQLKERVGLLQKEISSLKAAINNTQQDLNTLADGIKVGSESVKQEEGQLAVMKSNFDKGVIPATRLSEQQRDLAYAKSQYLAGLSQSWIARKSLGDLQLQLEQAIQSNREKALSELADSGLALEKIKSQLKAVAEKFTIVGGARSALYMNSDNDVAVEIHRKTGDAVNALQATVDTAVVPGDVIEVDLKPARLLGLASTDGAEK
jgi:glycosyltransferase involved in cell wall biosynthesis